MENNRQLRSWVFMLYPDNPLHEQAVNYLDHLNESLYIKHIAKYDDEGNLINKEHYHCVLKLDDPMWLSTLLKELNLPNEDSHLFHSYRDFKKGRKPRFKSLDDYIDYLDHQKETDKPDKYSIEDFHGGLKSLAAKIINLREVDKYLQLNDLSKFVKNYYLDHFLERSIYTFNDWFEICIDNGYGEIFYNEWYRMRDLLRAYINIT